MLLHSRLRARIAQPRTSPSKRLGSFNMFQQPIPWHRVRAYAANSRSFTGSLPATHARTRVVVRKCLHLLAASLSYCNAVRSSRSWGAPPGRTGGGAAETGTSNAVRAVAGRPAGWAGERDRRWGAKRANGSLWQAQRAGRAMAHGAAGVRATDLCGRGEPQPPIQGTGAGWRAGCRSQVCITPVMRGA